MRFSTGRAMVSPSSHNLPSLAPIARLCSVATQPRLAADSGKRDHVPPRLKPQLPPEHSNRLAKDLIQTVECSGEFFLFTLVPASPTGSNTAF